MIFYTSRRRAFSKRFTKISVTLLIASIPMFLSACATSTRTVSSNAYEQRVGKNISVRSYPYGAATFHQKSIPILEYHSISVTPNNPYCVNPTDFEAEMHHLRDSGYSTINFQDLAKAWLHGGKLPIKPILITFDDGYKDNYTNAYPVLKKYKFKATIFMVTGFAGRNKSLTWDEMLEMENSGLIDIQSHTVHHYDLTKIPADQTRAELVKSKADLESHLPNPVIAFCYPYGGYNESVIKTVKEAGYVFATIGKDKMASMDQGQWSLTRFLVNGLHPVKKFAAQF